jgi:hypothetical protein
MSARRFLGRTGRSFELRVLRLRAGRAWSAAAILASKINTWISSAPTRIASGRTVVRAKAVIQLRE